jgi:hypothetical protein
VVYALTLAVNTTGLKVNYIFVSDHGMSQPDTEHPLPTPAALDTSKFFISGDRMVVELIAKNPADIQPTYEALKKDAKDYDVYLRENMPAHLHSARSDDWHNRIGDIILLPHYPKLFNLYNHKLDKGQHGYDPATVKMYMPSFMPGGRHSKPHTEIAPFRTWIFTLWSHRYWASRIPTKLMAPKNWQMRCCRRGNFFIYLAVV